jgi:serine/threonine-protein kinase
MGRVWVAREVGTGRAPHLVAVKTALGEGLTSDDVWELFVDEARVASQIQHPNVCAIHGLDVHEGVAYLVMDWLDGGSLRELLDALPEHRLDLALAVRIIAQVALGLQAAHELVDINGAPLNIVHRDVSPQNILFTATGHVKLIDFGIAKARGQLHAPTETGQIKGKVSYMAPEQVTSKNVDGRADIFALGAVLYEATVGQHPFQGDDTLTTLYAILEEVVTPPSKLRPGFPPGLEAILVRALDRDVDARFKTAGDFARALETWLVSEHALVSEAIVGELVRKTLGKSIDQRAAAIRTAIAEVEAGRVNDTRARSAASGRSTETPGAVDASAPGKGPPRPYASIWPLVAGFGVALSIAGWLGARELRAASVTTVGSSASATAGAAVPAASSPSTDISVTIRIEPAQAVMYLDDGPPLPNPYTAVVKADTRRHRLRAVAPGFVERTDDIVFDQSREILMTLLVAPSARATALPRPSVPVHPAPRSAPSVQAAPGDLPPPTRAPRRALDTYNPFAQR